MAKKIPKTIKKPPLKITLQTPGSESEKVKKTKIRVIGIGGGGGNIVSEIASRMEKASFVVANTDIQALKTSSRRVIRFSFGQTFTHGLGTGMNPELGLEAAQNEKDKIKKLLEGQDLCILVSCLGGGTGSGATPVFAKISKNLGNLTYGIFTLPFKFEGEKKMEIAKESLKRIKGHLNAITLIPNERVFQIIDKTIPLKQAFSVINKSLAESLGGLIETIYEPGLINIDFADLRTILEGRGRLTYLNTVEVQRKKDSTKDLMAKVLNSPLYPYTIRGAKGVLFNITGEKKLSLAEVTQISKTISELVNPEAKIIFGISESQKYSDIIKTTLLATGCGMKIFSSKTKKKKTKKIRNLKVKPILKKKTIKKTKISQPKSISKPKTKKRPLRTRRNKPPKSKPLHQKFGVKGKPRKREIKVIKEPKVKTPTGPEVEEKVVTSNFSGEKIRKNALQIKKETEEAEREMLEKEKFWETPTFLRQKKFFRIE